MKNYDIIIIGGGASGLFCSAFLPKEAKKCILEKSDKLGTKVLLSGGERCNVTNINVDPSAYIGQNTRILPSVFHQWNQNDMINFLQEHGVETIVEDRGRVLLKSGKSKELLELLVHLAHGNDTETLLSQNISSISHLPDGHFLITTQDEQYHAKKLIIATGGMTYPQIGATPFGYEIAEQLGLSIASPHGALCGIETQEDLSLLAGSTVQSELALLYDNKLVYKNTGSLLFTHWGVSGPIVFDATIYMDQDIAKYSFQIDFDLSGTSKKVIQAFKLLPGDTIRDFRVKVLRPLSEAKVSVGGVLVSQFDQHFQSKTIPGLYFIGEALDITGKTGGYNLQWARSSAYVCGKGIT